MTSEPGVQHTVDKLMFNPAGTLLDVTANGMVDSVYDGSSGQLVMTLTNTQSAQFPADGALLIGGNAKHLIVWNTKDWTKLRDLPNGPDYVTRIAAFPENDLVIVGGPKAARLLRLSTGDEVARVGNGYTNFAAFNEESTLVFTCTSEGLSVWDSSGKRYCSAPDIGNGTTAVLPFVAEVRSRHSQDCSRHCHARVTMAQYRVPLRTQIWSIGVLNGGRDVSSR
jgi:hypothetical protein